MSAELYHACDFTNLLGIPHSKQNCVQLINNFYSNWSIPVAIDFYDNWFIHKQDIIKSILAKDFKKVTFIPEIGDLLVFSSRAFITHFAIYVGNNRMLHVLENELSCIESMDKWKKQLYGIYRINRV